MIVIGRMDHLHMIISRIILKHHEPLLLVKYKRPETGRPIGKRYLLLKQMIVLLSIKNGSS